MKTLGKMIDLKRSPKEAEKNNKEIGMPVEYDGPLYPYGLCLSLDSETLEKLDLSDDAEVGDTLHLFALAKVTSKSENQRESGRRDCRIELQMTHIALESEDAENEAADKQSRRYGADANDDDYE